MNFDPPEGWLQWGTHAALESVPELEFSEQVGEDGFPLWERHEGCRCVFHVRRGMGAEDYCICDEPWPCRGTVNDQLRATFTARAVRLWWDINNQHLGGVTPRTAWAESRRQEVWNVAASYRDMIAT